MYATLTTALLALLSPLAVADRFETLAGPRDTITIAEGEAALVLFVTQTPTVQYHKDGRRPVQFRLGATRRTDSYHSYSYPAQVERNPSSKQPLALAGPATISLMNNGIVSLRVVDPSKEE